MKISRTTTILLAIIILGAILRFFWSTQNPIILPGNNDPSDYSTLAQNLLQYKAYGYPLANNQFKHTAFRPPGYSFFLSLIYACCDINNQLVKSVQIILDLLTILMIFLLAKKIFSPKKALIAAFIYAVIPEVIFFTASLHSETLSVFLLITMTYFLSRKTKGAIAASGICWGLLCLTRPIFIFIPLIVIATETIPNFRSRKYFSRIMIFCLMGFLTILPWTIRNYHIAKKFILVSTNGGFNLFLGNNPYVENGRALGWPPQEYLERMQLKDNIYHAPSATAEYLLDTKFKQAALAWIFHNWKDFFRLYFDKLVHLLGPPEHIPYPYNYWGNFNIYIYHLLDFISQLFYYPLFLAVILGFILIHRIPQTEKFLTRYINAFIIIYLAVISLFFGDARFHYPLLPFFCILAVNIPSRGKPRGGKISLFLICRFLVKTIICITILIAVLKLHLAYSISLLTNSLQERNRYQLGEQIIKIKKVNYLITDQYSTIKPQHNKRYIFKIKQPSDVSVNSKLQYYDLATHKWQLLTTREIDKILGRNNIYSLIANPFEKTDLDTKNYLIYYSDNMRGINYYQLKNKKNLTTEKLPWIDILDDSNNFFIEKEYDIVRPSSMNQLASANLSLKQYGQLDTIIFSLSVTGSKNFIELIIYSNKKPAISYKLTGESGTKDEKVFMDLTALAQPLTLTITMINNKQGDPWPTWNTHIRSIETVKTK